MPNYSGTFTPNAHRESSMTNPIGTILPFAGTYSMIPDGWLLCDGQHVLRTTYNQLFAILSVTWGDGSQDPNGTPTGFSGTHFNLPDFRGLFMRGLNFSPVWGASTAGFSTVGGRDPDSGSRYAILSGGAPGNSIGAAQPDALQDHNMGAPPTPATGAASQYLAAPRNAAIHDAGSGAGFSGKQTNAGSFAANGAWGTDEFYRPMDGQRGASVPRVSNESRPQNRTINYIIRAY
jgi:microcystin-dependent protein